MANVTNPFVHRELSHAREIRLIHLSYNPHRDKLSIQIEHHSLDDDNLDFVALSYVWGPQEPSISIICETSELGIGPNLDRLLRLLVQQNWSDKLFIDRLSINQDSPDERAQQVLLMGEIFGRAKLVLVWLGNATSTTELAFTTISRLANDAIREQEKSGNSATTPHNITYPAFNDPEAAAIRQVLKTEWFTRVWTFQEIVLAKAAVFKCGNYHMPWSHLENLLVGLEMFPPGTDYEHGFLRGAEDAAFEMVKSRVYRRRRQDSSLSTVAASVSLTALLHELRKRHATDPRDKVYALLNVATDISPNDLRPDYRLSHLEVYAITCKRLLERHKNLGFLSLVEKKDRPDLVSWVPDFRFKDTLNFLHQAGLTFQPSQDIWRASGTARARPLLQTTPLLHLPVHAVRVGKVVAMTDPPGNLVGNVALGSKVLDGGEWEQFARAATEKGTYKPTGEPVDLAFRRLRVWDSLPGEGSRRRSRPYPLSQANFPPIPHPLETVTSIANLNQWHRGDIASWVLNGTTRKRMFKTDTGYLGLARRCLELGDEIFILMGFDTPCALRRIGGELYSFGGEAYVHGAMDGEFLLRLAERRSPEESINGLGGDDAKWFEDLASHSDARPFPVIDLTLV